MLACWLALVVIAGYAIDAAGVGVAPWAVLVIATIAVAALARVGRHIDWRATGDLLPWIGVCVFVTLALLRMAWPALLPPGRGPDLTHHLLLVDYIEQHGHLVHDRSLDGSMGEMAHYTPGAHLLAVLIGKWVGSDGLRVFFPLLTGVTALTAGFVFLICRRLLLAIPYSIVAVILLFLPAQYFYGAFTHDSFLAQMVATFFAVAAWWALIAWDEEPHDDRRGDHRGAVSGRVPDMADLDRPARPPLLFRRAPPLEAWRSRGEGGPLRCGILPSDSRRCSSSPRFMSLAVGGGL